MISGLLVARLAVAAAGHVIRELTRNVARDFTTSLTLPIGVTGLYYVIAAADGSAVVAESSETNNTLLRMITIGS